MIQPMIHGTASKQRFCHIGTHGKAIRIQAVDEESHKRCCWKMLGYAYYINVQQTNMMNMILFSPFRERVTGFVDCTEIGTITFSLPFVLPCGASNNNLISRGCLQSSAPLLWPTSLSSASCLQWVGRNGGHLQGPWLQWGQKRAVDRCNRFGVQYCMWNHHEAAEGDWWQTGELWRSWHS